MPKITGYQNKKKNKKKIKEQTMLKPDIAIFAFFFFLDKVVNFTYSLSYLQANVSFSVQKYRKPYIYRKLYIWWIIQFYSGFIYGYIAKMLLFNNNNKA